jgi:hypothetical protein
VLVAGGHVVVLLRCWVSGLPATQPFTRHADTALWLLHLELPAGSRFDSHAFGGTRYAAFSTVLDNLIHRLEVAP